MVLSQQEECPAFISTVESGLSSDRWGLNTRLLAKGMTAESFSDNETFLNENKQTYNNLLVFHIG